MSNTKFWLAVGISAAMVALLAIYLFRTQTPQDGIVVGLLGVITLVVGGYFTSNVVASGQAVSSTTTTDTPGKTVVVEKPKDGA